MCARRQPRSRSRGACRPAGQFAAALRALSGALLLALLTAPAAAGLPQPLDGYRVARPGDVLFERHARKEALQAADADDRRALCAAGDDSWTSHRAVTTLRAPDGYGGDWRPEPFNWTVMTAAAAAFGVDDDRAVDALVANLRRWARGRGLTRVAEPSAANYYSIDRALLPLIVAWGLVRDRGGLDAGERALIDSWLEGAVRLRGQRPAFADDSSAHNNHSYLRDSVDMAYGALVGDDARFRLGIERYTAALRQMRADGSFPLEVQRGARALWYQRHAIASLVAIAEMAAVQGYDLYGLEIEGRSLHRAIGFLLDALDDQSLVWPYAAANVSPGPLLNYRVQDLGFMRRRGHGRHYMAWSEPYLARFPERDEARRLAKALEAFDPAARPMIDEYSGGATSCFFAEVGRR